MSHPHIAIVGLDGANLSTIRQGAEAGRLPTFARLLREGASGTLASIRPPSTVPAWKVMTTGKNPGKLGYFDFVSKKPNSYQQVLFNSTLVNEKEIWHWAAEAGQRVAVFNVPGTYPPSPVNGALVCDMLTPSIEVPFTYPPNLQVRLPEIVGGPYSVDIIRPASGDLDEELALIRHVTHQHVAVCKYLLNEFQPDFFMGVLTATDKVQHHFWHFSDPAHRGYSPEAPARYRDAIMDVYALIDGVLAELLDLLDGANVLIASDHGGRGFNGRFHVNEWLRRQGLLAPVHDVRDHLRGSPIHSLIAAMPPWVKAAIRPFTRQAIGHNLIQPVDALFDMSRTKAYVLTSGQLYLNVKGRDPQGVVEPGAEYEELITFLRETLPHVPDPNGRPLEFRAWRPDEIYSGPYLDRAPDLLIEAVDPYYEQAINLPDHDGLFSHFDEHYRDFAGTHHPLGVVMAVGPDIAPGVETQADILDIAPTALHLMGLAAPEDADGRVLAEIIRPGSEAAARPVRTQPASVRSADEIAMSREDQQIVGARLRDLGYLE
jgi:predicted AlkP superfamily phosphohydrolase/phosphomutase